MNWEELLKVEGLPLSCKIEFVIQNGGVQVISLNNKATRVTRRFRQGAGQLLKLKGGFTFPIANTRTTKFFVNGGPVSDLRPYSKPERWKEPSLTGNNHKSRELYHLNVKRHIHDIMQPKAT